MDDELVLNLREWQSTKRVHAGKITRVVPAGCYVEMLDGNSTLLLYQDGMTVRYTPKVGDYWVVYGPDGYASISPYQQFKDGYVTDTP